MARARRSTQPLETVHGTLTSFAEIDPYLIEAELKGRQWALSRAAMTPPLSTPTDADIRELHLVMFEGFLPWAGSFRRRDVGPGGIVNVPWLEVPQQMRLLSDDLRAWVEALPADPGAGEVASIVADAHARFQWVHPFEDTNGRTGRVLDLYLIWVTFGLARGELASAPILDPFPTEAQEDEYYFGLQEADGYRPARLRAYYTDRIVAAFNSPG